MNLIRDLIANLQQLVTVYRHLSDIVDKEHEVIVKAEVQEIPIINEAKERLIHKVRLLDQQWMEIAQKIQQSQGEKVEPPQLKKIAETVAMGKDKQELLDLHQVLNLLVSRLAEKNKKNEVLVQSALSHITGAMNSITKTLNENPTYKQSGSMKPQNKDAQGRLVSREV